MQVDVRVIAASNRDLERAVKDGQFRQDLYYRLAIISIFLPTLRERKEDILPLVEFFISRYNRKFRKNVTGITDETRKLMLKYDWPGNVRELKNVIERVLILNPHAQRIERRHLPMLVHRSAGRTGDFDTLQQARDAYEREYILKKIDDCNGNMSRAAETLGLERSHLYRKMKALGISVRESSTER
jgi:two-component system nitrogen regulation response regulator NtrX